MHQPAHNLARGLASKLDTIHLQARKLEKRIIQHLIECGCQYCVNMEAGYKKKEANE